ncbi:MAG: hypothetical protein QM723_09950 [Myxococcaceae bacterium]
MRTVLFLLIAAAALAPSLASAQLCAVPDGGVPPNDGITDTRVLRRIALSLTGTTPAASEYEALLAAAPQDRQAMLDQAVDDALAAPAFYTQMVNFGHDWIAVGAYTTGAQGDAYQGDMAGHLFTCGGSTAHPGALYSFGEYPNNPENVCDDKDGTGASITVAVNNVEPWWAPGTTVTVVGAGGTNVKTVMVNGQPQDCGMATGGYYDPTLAPGCGCGPNLVWCAPLSGLSAGSYYDLYQAQRRHPYEEPARLFAHLAWYDRPLSDLVTGNYSVATNWLRSLYVRQGRQQGSNASDANTTWWKAASDTAPRDPLHPTPNDPQAWREYKFSDLNPYLIDDRSYQFDPRTTTAAPQGWPSAGVLTMIGSLSSFPRERVRAARFLETFACQSFAPPPADVQFPPYANDPATSGTCMHCHQTLDPAAIHFKRWDFGGDSYYVPWPFIGGMGRYRMTPEWLSGQYPYGPDNHNPAFRWMNAFKPGTVLTPVTAADVTANPEAVLLDTMPPSYTLLGTHGDGTMGPLGFGKILIASGEFDRCSARRLYQRFIGRPLDPAAEKLYIDKLAAQFVAGGRQVRPFVRYLLKEPEFRRGL